MHRYTALVACLGCRVLLFPVRRRIETLFRRTTFCFSHKEGQNGNRCSILSLLRSRSHNFLQASTFLSLQCIATDVDFLGFSRNR
jgi:hypothetical protein